MPERSDPAEQLFKLCDMLRKHKSDQQAVKAFAQTMGVKAHSADYHVLVGVIASRFARLDAFVQVEVKGVGPKDNARKSLEQLQEFLSLPAKGGGSWDSVRSGLFPDPAMSSLLMLSEIVGEKAPIAVPTPQERSEVIAKIDVALTALEKEQDAISAALHSSLSASKRMIERFEFWGGETLTDEILKSVMLYETAVNHRAPTSKGTLSSVALAISILLNVNAGIDAQITAINNNYTLFSRIIEYFPKPKLLIADQRERKDDQGNKEVVIPNPPTATKKRRPPKTSKPS